MNYSISEHQPTIQILELSNLFNELDNHKILHAAVKSIERGYNHLIVDLTSLKFMNSVGLNLLLSLHKKSKKSGGCLTVVNVPSQVLSLLEITKLSSHFTLKNTVEEALEDF